MDGNLDNINKMMSGLGGDMIGSMFKKEEKKEMVIIDDNFSTSQVDLGKIKENPSINIGKMLNVADSFGVLPNLNDNNDNNDNKMPQLNELFGMMNNLDKANTKEGALDLKNKLNGMLGTMGIDMNKMIQELDMKKTVQELEKTKNNSKPNDLD